MHSLCEYLIPSWCDCFDKPDADSRSCLLPVRHHGPHLCLDESRSEYVVWERESQSPGEPLYHGDEEEAEDYWRSVDEDADAEDVLWDRRSAAELLANVSNWPGLENHIKSIVDQRVGVPCD